MIALLLALCVAPPAWKDEILCWDSGVCRPRVVSLGEFDIRPPPGDWSQNAVIPAPKAWREDETGLHPLY